MKEKPNMNMYEHAHVSVGRDYININMQISMSK